MSSDCAFLSVSLCLHPKQVGPTDAARCAACPLYQGRVRGMGDVVHGIAKATGIDKVAQAVSGGKDCGCQKRREALNRAMPFADPHKKES